LHFYYYGKEWLYYTLAKNTFNSKLSWCVFGYIDENCFKFLTKLFLVKDDFKIN